MVERSFAMMIGLLGIIKAGAAYLPIAPDGPPDRADYFLADAGARILLTQQATAPRSGFSGRILNLGDSSLYRGPATNPSILNSPRDLAYVIYTSGSTGVPKGVMIEHRSLINRLTWMQHAYPIGPADVILQKTPYTFDVSVWELFWWALQGASVCMLPPGAERNPLAIVDCVRKHQVTVMHFVPSMLSVFLQYLEAKGRMKMGDKVWQIGFGSGFKANSAVWKCISEIDSRGRNAWSDRIHLYPVCGDTSSALKTELLS